MPWERQLDDVRSPQYAPRRCKVIRSVGGPVVAYDIGISRSLVYRLVAKIRTAATGSRIEAVC
jgi:hypothetical protein